MKLLLDENITPRAKTIFEQLGYDVVSIHSLGLRGQSDTVVFKAAQAQQRALLTENGKDFVVQVPPRMQSVNHEGLLWIKYAFKRSQAQVNCQEIDDFLKREKSIANSIWKHEENGLVKRFVKVYPL
ncbi:DUF5615 family PIN-like protein [Priestia sp. RMT2NF4]|uniref:DUF5615 family PIN-like protein n=1 Tax=Priestia sp. RMT2NF4 TaxID=3398394 RepID=UPI003A4C5B9E